jgi:hypothetical protein
MKRETRAKKNLVSALPKRRDDLIRIILDQAERIDSLRQEIESLQSERDRLRKKDEQRQKRIQDANKQIDELRKQLEEAQRAPHRQAAPFRVPEAKRKAEPKRPGRRAGHPGACRPKPDHVNDDVSVDMLVCPNCGGPVHDVEDVEQFIEEIPPIRPHVTRLVTHVGQCARCGEVRSMHPMQVSTATQAAGTHLGPRAQALAIDLNQRLGLTTRKTCRVLADCFGLSLTAGGLVHLKHRRAGQLEGAFEALRAEARTAPVAHLDETGWWVGGPGYWLWVCTNPTMTLYAVRDSRARAVVHELLGEHFEGVLVSDCLNIYDEASAVQQKCFAHHHKAVSDAAKRHAQGETEYLRAVRQLLRDIAQLKTDQATLSRSAARRRRRELEQTAQRLFVPRRRNAVEESVALRFRKQLDHLFTCLDYPAVPTTNNLAERQLRPAVIARKLSCGNRTDKGAHTWEVLASLAATADQRHSSFVALLDKTARLQQPP